MELANIWRQGQIFAFSALDGESKMGDDFVGTLSGDRIGVRFYTKVKRELAIVGYKVRSLEYKAVLSDCISAQTNKGPIRIIYHNTHLIVGDVCEGAVVKVFLDGPVNIEQVDGVEVQDTMDEAFTALCVEGNRFAFAYSKDKQTAINTAKEGMKVDIDQAEEKKLAFQTKHGIEGKYSKLYSKCLSVMKSLLYSPEERFDRIWCTPDRLPHKYLWIWDSVLNAVGMRHINGDVAEGMILALFKYQHEDGMISHMVNFGRLSKITQPPVIAWGAWKVYAVTKNKDFLRQIYEGNKKFLDWCRRERTKGEDELYAWFISDIPATAFDTCRCDESALDNSPRFDDVLNLQAIDFSCYIANEARLMGMIADEIGEDGTYYKEYYELLKGKINAKLWSDDFYYDYDLDSQSIKKVKGITSFWPMFAHVCDREQAEKLVAALKDPKQFGTEFPVPSIALDDPTYKVDMWCGPCWLSTTYYVIDGLRECGYFDLANEVSQQVLAGVNQWYTYGGALYEFFDAENRIPPTALERKGPIVEPYNFDIRVQTIRDYGWTASLCLDLITHLDQ